MLVYDLNTIERKNKKGNINLLLESLTYDLKFNELKEYYYVLYMILSPFPLKNIVEKDL